VSFIIGPADLADAGELWTLQRAAFVDEARQLRNPLIPPLDETLEEVRIAFTEVTFLKVVDGTRIIGGGRLRNDGEAGWIERIAIAPDQQGRGIGSALLTALEAAARPNTRRFELFTAAPRSQNVAFYLRHGYSEVERIGHEAGVEIVHFAKPR
jgi:GNAT superfamily N-acetyltransferase